jgi:hypothetical protein
VSRRPGPGLLPAVDRKLTCGGRAALAILRGMKADDDGLLRRVLGQVSGQASGADPLGTLADSLSGADLTSVLLEVMRRRAVRLRPSDVLRQYRTDRFVGPASTGFRDLRRVEDAMIAALPESFDVVVLAPVLPLGAHSAFAGVDPRNVIATIRRTEVAADPTNALALEAAVQRRAAPASGSQPIRLAATQRVTRAQQFDRPGSFAHFQLLGAVTAGRDTGGHAFERQHLIEHLKFAVSGCQAAGAHEIRIAITRLDEVAASILADVQAAFAGQPDVQVADVPERQSGRAYYRCLCFKVYAGPVELGDGGFTDWTEKLIGSRKERLLISGYGLDRLAALTSQPKPTPNPAARGA